MVLYIYILRNGASGICVKCHKRLEELKKYSISYVERDSLRLKDVSDLDSIDMEALVQLSFQDNTFPVEVEVKDEEL